MSVASIAGPIATFWGMRRKPYYCPICGEAFGLTTSSRARQRKHFQIFHPEFFDWNNRFGRIGNWFAVGSFIYVGSGLVLVSAEGNSSVVGWLYFLGFLAIATVTWLGIFYWRLQVRSFKRSWKGLRIHMGSAPMPESTADDSKLDTFLKEPKTENVES